MREDLTGLSRYNPLCISRECVERGDFCAEITLFLLKNPETLFCFNIPKLLKERQTLISVYTFALKQSKMQVFTSKFKELIDTLMDLVGKPDELFWDNLYVLEQIVLKDSIIKECRTLITDNLQKIVTILTEAQKREKDLKKDDINKISKYAIMSFYVSNKFKSGSDINDDTLFEFLLDKFLDRQNFNIALFADISLYKNCDKFDLSWQDIINEFQNMDNCAVDYSWIFIPYGIRYRKTLEEKILNSVGDAIYSYWFDYLLSADFIKDTIEYSNAEIKENCRNAVDAFKSQGIYTYECNKLFGKIMKERNRYG